MRSTIENYITHATPMRISERFEGYDSEKKTVICMNEGESPDDANVRLMSCLKNIDSTITMVSLVNGVKMSRKSISNTLDTRIVFYASTASETPTGGTAEPESPAPEPEPEPQTEPPESPAPDPEPKPQTEPPESHAPEPQPEPPEPPTSKPEEPEPARSALEIAEALEEEDDEPEWLRFPDRNVTAPESPTQVARSANVTTTLAAEPALNLVGVIPPTLLLHLATMSNVTLLSEDGKRHYVSRQGRGVRVGNVLVDLQSWSSDGPAAYARSETVPPRQGLALRASEGRRRRTGLI